MQDQRRPHHSTGPVHPPLSDEPSIAVLLLPVKDNSDGDNKLALWLASLEPADPRKTRKIGQSGAMRPSS
jgi:hypothetical protein